MRLQINEVKVCNENAPGIDGVASPEVFDQKLESFKYEITLDSENCWNIPEVLYNNRMYGNYNLMYLGQLIGNINYQISRIEVVINDPTISIKISKEIKTGHCSIKSAGKVTLLRNISADYFSIESKSESELSGIYIQSHEISLGGKINAKKSILRAKKILSTKLKSEISMEHTHLISGVTLKLAGHTEATSESELSAKYVSLDGDLVLSDSAVVAERSLIQFPKTTIQICDGSLVKAAIAKLSGIVQLDNKSLLTTEQLEFNKIVTGAKSKVEATKLLTITSAVEVNFKECVIEAYSILNQDKLIVVRSYIIGDHIRNEGEIQLSQSGIELKQGYSGSENAIWKIEGSDLNTKHGTLSGKNLISESFVNASESFWQFGKMECSKSKIEALEIFTGSDSKTVANYSQFKAHQAELNGDTQFSEVKSALFKHITLRTGHLHLKKSFLRGEDSVISHTTSSIQVDEESTLESKVAIFDSQLNASKQSRLKFIDAVLLKNETHLDKSLLESNAIYCNGDKTSSFYNSRIRSKTIYLSSPFRTDQSYIIADLSLVVDKSSVCMLKNTHSKIGSDFNVFGTIKFVDSTVQTNNAVIDGGLEASKSIFIIGNKFETKQNSKFSLSNQSALKAKSIQLEGNTEVVASALKAEDKITINTTLFGSKVGLQAKSIVLDGRFELGKSVVYSRVLLLAKDKQKQIDIADDQIILQKQGTTITAFWKEYKQVSERTLDLRTEPKILNSFSKDDRELNDEKLIARIISLFGCSQSLVKAETDIIMQKGLRLVVDRARFEAGQQILLAQNSFVTGDGLSLKADLLTNYGTVIAKDHLTMDVEQLWNQSGVLKGHGSTNIKVNKYFFSLFGQVGGARTHIAVSIPLYVLSDICGSDSLTIIEGIPLNLLCLYRSWNVNINSVFNFLPRFFVPLTMPSTVSSVFSYQRNLMFSRMMLNTMLPSYGSSINLAHTAIPIIPWIIAYAGQGAKSLTTAIMNRDFSILKQSLNNVQQRMSNAKFIDILSVLLNGKNLAMAGAGLGKIGHDAYKEYSQNFTWDKFLESLKNVDADNLGWNGLEHFGTAFGPSYSSASVFNFNFFRKVAPDISKIDLKEENYGVKNNT